MPVYPQLADLVTPSRDRVLRSHELARRAGPHVAKTLRGSIRNLAWKDFDFSGFAHFRGTQAHLLRKGALGSDPARLSAEHHAFHINEISLGLAMAAEYPLAALHWLGPLPGGRLQANPKFGGLEHSKSYEAFLFDPADAEANIDQFEYHPRFVSVMASKEDYELANLAVNEEGNVSLRYHQSLGAITTLVFQGVIREVAPERNAPFRFVTTDHNRDVVLQDYAEQVTQAFCNAPTDFAAYTDHQQVRPLLETLSLYDSLEM